MFRCFRIEFGVEVNGAAGDIQSLGPGGEAFFLDADLMAARGEREGGRRIADKATVDFDVGSGGCGVENQRCLY